MLKESLFTYNSYVNLLVLKITSLTKQVSCYPFISKNNLISVLSRWLYVYHGCMDIKISFSTLKNSENLNDLFGAKASIGNFHKYYLHSRNIIRRTIFKLKSIYIHKDSILIPVSNSKYITYVYESNLFENQNIVWLVYGNVNFKNIDFKEDCVLKYQSFYYFDEHVYPFNLFHSDLECINYYLKMISPKAVFLFEGDDTSHILLSNAANAFKIPNFCFQWGILHQSKIKCAFCYMEFSCFFTWGKIFTDQLKPYNPNQIFHEIGRLGTSEKVSTGNKIIFLDAGGARFISKCHQDLFLDLLMEVSSKFPKRVFLRPHPNHLLNQNTLQRLENAQISISDPQRPIVKDLEGCSIAVSIYSSSILDAIWAGVVPISFKFPEFEPYPIPLNKMKIGYESESYSHVLGFINKLVKEEIFLNKYRANLSIKKEEIFSSRSNNQIRKVINDFAKSKIV